MSGYDYCALALLLFVLLLVWWAIMRRRRRAPYGLPVAYGLDFSWGRPGVDAILAGGWTFVCRYHSWSESGKNLTPDEAAMYLAAGIDVVSNWEYDAGEAKGGYDAGASNAAEAVRQQDWCGGTSQDPIYFSVDYDVNMSASYSARAKRAIREPVNVCRRAAGKAPSGYDVVADYFRGIASVIGVERTGAYGEYDVIARLFNDGLITYGWQTYAWSYGRWDPRAQLRQVLNGQTVDGAAVDFNEAWHPDFGAWGQRRPPQNGDGHVILNDPQNPGRIDLFYVGSMGEVWHHWYSDGLPQAWSNAGKYENLGGAVYVGTLSAQWLPDGSGINIVGLGVPEGEDCPPTCGQYWGTTIYRSGVKTGWGSMVGAYGQCPGEGMYPYLSPPEPAR